MDLRKKPVSAQYLRLPLNAYANAEKPALGSGFLAVGFEPERLSRPRLAQRPDMAKCADKCPLWVISGHGGRVRMSAYPQYSGVARGARKCVRYWTKRNCPLLNVRFGS